MTKSLLNRSNKIISICDLGYHTRPTVWGSSVQGSDAWRQVLKCRQDKLALKHTMYREKQTEMVAFDLKKEAEVD